jgi:hypothetical protein
MSTSFHTAKVLGAHRAAGRAVVLPSAPVWIFLGTLGLGAACREVANAPTSAAPENSAEPSPNARIYPAPLQSGAELMTRERIGSTTAESDAGPPPQPLREDEALPLDALKVRDTALVTLHGRFVALDLPAPPGFPELDKLALQKAAEKVWLTTTVHLAPTGRMRFELTGHGFPLPAGTELRARTDRFGHVLVWPDGKSYRIVPPGALRAVLNERRADVLPLTAGIERPQANANVLGLDGNRLEIGAQLGKVVITRASVAGTDAGPLLCRLLLELLGVHPSSTACHDGRAPLRAEYTWHSGARLNWEITRIERTPDRSIQPLLVPPPEPWFKGDLLPERPSPLLLGRTELTALRQRDAPPARPRSDPAVSEGLSASNRGESPRYLVIDGVPVAWLPAHSSTRVVGLRPGRYLVCWRDLLGSVLDPPTVVEVPGKVSIGEDPDAGTEAAR